MGPNAIRAKAGLFGWASRSWHLAKWHRAIDTASPTNTATATTSRAAFCDLFAFNFGRGAWWNVGSSNTIIAQWQTCVGNTEFLAYQTDGNFVLYRRTNVNQFSIWEGGGGFSTPDYVIFQDDGNFVNYNLDAFGGSFAAWASDTNNRGAQSLMMQRDGNVVIYQNTNGIFG